MKKIFLVVILLAIILPSSARAESTFDLYFGQVDTDSNRFTHIDGGGFTFTTTDNFNESPAFGIRANNWFERNPNLGVALDFSYFRPDGYVTAVDTLPLSLLLAIRTPASSSYRPSKWFLYCSAGPSIYLFDMHARLPFGDTFKGIGADFGLDARIGINWRASGNMGFFVELRHTRFDVNGTYEDIFGWVRESISMDIVSNHINIGFSF